MSANGIAHLISKQLKQEGKLAIAEAKRQGKIVAIDGTISGSANALQPFARTLSNLDIDMLPTKYSGNVIIDNTMDNDVLLHGRPWYYIGSLTGDVSIDEGVNGTFTVTASSALSLTLYWTINNVTSANADFAAVSGTVALVNGVGTITISPSADGATEGAETFTVSVRRDSISGTVLATSASTTINDISQYSAGSYRRTYTGDWTGDVTFFNTAVQTATTVTGNFTIPSEPADISEQYVAYFKPDYTGVWTFAMSSDDGSALWIGTNAVSGYTLANALIDNSGNHAVVTLSATISLVSGQYYPVRLMYSNTGGPGSLDVTYAHPGQTATNNFASPNKLFYNGVTNGL